MCAPVVQKYAQIAGRVASLETGPETSPIAERLKSRLHRLRRRANQREQNTIPWCKGLESMPPSLRNIEFGCDSTGTPYVEVTLPTCKASHVTHWGMAGDPNLKSFYDMYVFPTGAGIHVARGIASRWRETFGKVMDRARSQIDRKLNQIIAQRLPAACSLEEAKRLSLAVKAELRSAPDILKWQAQYDEVSV
jgi:hypothetical protein